MMQARHEATKVSLIKQNAAVSRHIEESKNGARTGRAGGANSRRMSPLWVDKIDPGVYFRKDKVVQNKQLPQDFKVSGHDMELVVLKQSNNAQSSQPVSEDVTQLSQSLSSSSPIQRRHGSARKRVAPSSPTQ